ncbi:hypothetical protein PO181_07590 [Leuconostoc suionicum]|uniref:hypothetical protein n=1 Tax=Leuconostoc suionicum TaxID=1511761 RepID=UPI00233E76EB|nr:hypothetical protein [Leuconostoc suionicum]MDC2816841.1 hypothetical protein [Leuconostoc suionicum]
MTRDEKNATITAKNICPLGSTLKITSIDFDVIILTKTMASIDMIAMKGIGLIFVLKPKLNFHIFLMIKIYRRINGSSKIGRSILPTTLPDVADITTESMIIIIGDKIIGKATIIASAYFFIKNFLPICTLHKIYIILL